MEEVIGQTFHPIAFFDPVSGKLTYANRAAQEEYRENMQQFLEHMPDDQGRFEQEYEGRQMLFETVPLEGESTILITATDTSEIAWEQATLGERIRELEKMGRELEESRRNIDAYLDSMPGREDLYGKKTLVDETWALAGKVFARVEENLEAAKGAGNGAEERLQENLDLTRDCIAAIRKTVAQLREGGS